MKITSSLLFLIFLIICLLEGFNGYSEKTIKVTYVRKPGLRLNIKTQFDYELGAGENQAMCWESLKTLQYFGSPTVTTKEDNLDKSSIFYLQDANYYKCFDTTVGVSFMKTVVTYETIPDNQERIKTVTLDPQIMTYEVHRRVGKINGFRFTYATYSYLDYEEPAIYLGTVEHLNRKKDEEKHRKGTLKEKEKSEGKSSSRMGLGCFGGSSGGGSELSQQFF